MGKVIKIPSAFVINTKVVGVSHQNPDGSSRQQIIRHEVKEDDIVQLVPEPENTYDKNAVSVQTNSGHSIGYLNKEIAEKVHHSLSNEVTVKAIVSWVSEREIKGVGLRIELVN